MLSENLTIKTITDTIKKNNEAHIRNIPQFDQTFMFEIHNTE